MRDLRLLAATLNNWRKLEGAPKPNRDSSWDVAVWRAFMAAHDLKGLRGQRGPGAETGGDEKLKARKLWVELDTKEVKLAVLRGRSIPVGKVREL